MSQGSQLPVGFGLAPLFCAKWHGVADVPALGLDNRAPPDNDLILLARKPSVIKVAAKLVALGEESVGTEGMLPHTHLP